jgi:two-component system cell cycle response regulator DivK
MNSYNWKGKIILVVEDDEISLEFLKELFEPFHVKLLTASDGVEAIRICKSEPDINLILMDVQLPVMNGKDAMKQIRTFNPKIPVLAQTAFAMSGDRERYLKEGFDDYISKPINVQELLNIIQNYLK